MDIYGESKFVMKDTYDPFEAKIEQWRMPGDQMHFFWAFCHIYKVDIVLYLTVVPRTMIFQDDLYGQRVAHEDGIVPKDFTTYPHQLIMEGPHYEPLVPFEPMSPELVSLLKTRKQDSDEPVNNKAKKDSKSIPKKEDRATTQVSDKPVNNNAKANPKSIQKKEDEAPTQVSDEPVNNKAKEDPKSIPKKITKITRQNNKANKNSKSIQNKTIKKTGQNTRKRRTLPRSTKNESSGKTGICCALDRCVMRNDNDINIHRRVPNNELRMKCSICNQLGHNECFEKEKKKNVCLKCVRDENNDNVAFASCLNDRLPGLMNAKSKEMWLDTNNRDMIEMENAVRKKFDLKHNAFSRDNFTKVKKSDLENQKFEDYVVSAFEKWGVDDDFWKKSSTLEKQTKIIEDIQDDIDNCETCRNRKKRRISQKSSKNKISIIFSRCNNCCAKMATIDGHKTTWKNARTILSKRYQASLPGFVLGLKYISQANIVAQCGHYDKDNKLVKTTLIVDFSWVVRTYGQEYAAFLVSLKDSSDKFIPLNKEWHTEINGIRMDRVITRIKYKPPEQVKDYKETKTNKSNLQAHKRLKRHAIFLCQDANGKSFPVTENELKSNLDNEYIELIKSHANTDGFINVPAGNVRKTSLLHKHPKLVTTNSPELRYLQGDEDLCVVKSFVSALHHIGFESEAAEIDRLYNLRKSDTETKANAMETTIRIAEKVLPKTFAYKQFGPGEFDYCKLKKHSVFLGCIETSDGHVNHAVTLFQDHIFDSNEKVALRLSREGMNYCSNDSADTLQFKRFAKGYLITCTTRGWRNTFAKKKKERNKRIKINA